MDVQGADGQPLAASGELRILVALEGNLAVGRPAGGGTERLAFPTRSLLPMPPGEAWQVFGAGRVGVLTVLNVLSHEARRQEGGGAVGDGPGPEYVPPARA
jgi:hypothetical protein